MSATLALRRATRGFTLVELMIALTISLFVVGALIVVVLGASSSSAARERNSEIQTNGRYALEQIKRDLQHSGFLGISGLFFPDDPITPGISVTNTCDTATIGKLSQRVFGADGNPFAATCIPAANYLRGDVLVIRGLDPTVVAAPYASNRVYYRSAYEGGQPFKGPTPPDFTGTNKQPPYIDHLLNETIYYISPYTESAAESPQVPALYRLRLENGPTMRAELIATGVEHLQVRYGVFQTNDTVRYLNASEMGSGDWDLVRSVQVFILMRSTSTETDYVNNTSYAMGDTTYTVNDAYPRLLLTAVVQLRN